MPKITNKLTYENQWESDTYKVNGKRVTDLKVVQIAEAKYRVEGKLISVEYNDMGSIGQGISTHYFIKARIFGMQMTFDLNEIVPKVKVLAIEYSV